MRKCPQCGGFNTRRSRQPFHRKSLGTFFSVWFRCRDCRARFQGTDWVLASKWFALCAVCVGVVTAGYQWRHGNGDPPRIETDFETPSALPQNLFASETLAVGGAIPFGVKEAAEGGDPDAQYRLVVALLQEHREYGRREALEQAMKWLKEAASQGHARAQVMLGAMYEEGRGVIQDFVEAVKWFRKAAEQGAPDALYRLGLMAAEGKGSPKDFVQAYVWFNLAAARGETQAELARDRIRAIISDAEVAEAQERSRLLNQKLPEPQADR